MLIEAPVMETSTSVAREAGARLERLPEFQVAKLVESVFALRRRTAHIGRAARAIGAHLRARCRVAREAQTTGRISWAFYRAKGWNGPSVVA